MKKIYSLFILVLISVGLLADPNIYAPALTSPADGATGQTADVLLDWDAVAGTIGVYYQLQYALDENFTNPVEITTDLTSYKTSLLLFNTEYFWRVRAIDNTGTSDWSEIRSFFVMEKISLSKPNNNANDQMPDVILKWSGVSGVSFYNIEIDTTTDFNSPLKDSFWIDGALAADTMDQLYFNTSYFWRARAGHQNDTSDWSDVRKFTVLKDFKLRQPPNNAVDRMPDVELKWDEVTGITGYIYQLSLNSNFEPNEEYFTTLKQLNVDPPLEFGVNYYWRVLAFHGYDSSDWSETRNFTIIDEVFPYEPSNGETGLGLYPTFSWQVITGIESYTLQLDPNPDFTNPLTRSIPAVAGTYHEYKWLSPALDNNKTYYWRVKAVGEDDVSGWSDTWSFTVGTSAVPTLSFENGSVSLYPNPGQGMVNLTITCNRKMTLKITVMDLVGQTIFRQDVITSNGTVETRLDLNHLSNGIYLIKFDHNGVTHSSKLVIRK